MVETIRNAWKIKELRNKILFTLMIIVVFRVGCAIPVPFLNPAAIQAFLQANSDTIFGYFDMLTGGAFAQATLFAMSITPYINASIIIQLLTVAIPALERMSKDGDEGRKKLTRITRYVTIALGMVQGFGYYAVLNSYGAVSEKGFFPGLVIVATFTAGTALLMWLADQVNDKGIGNGISIILFAGIIARAIPSIQSLIAYMQVGTLNIIGVIALLVGALAIVAFVVWITNAERRIPIQYAKRVVGRKMYGGQSSHLPIKVNMTGVLPIIFASAIVSLPATIVAFLPNKPTTGFWAGFLNMFSTSSPVYAALYFILIILFSYFYVAIQFNPVEMSNNIKKNGGFIPGIRPGKPTSDFIAKVTSKITLFGALFLAIIAAIPIILTNFTSINLSFSGTSVLILVGVALETVKQMESQMLMRHYKGFLE
ncbi:preprotein translocase subunit SecY [Feifania hominis]|uniref:Protein translocase subunit SecY n=1 Tax=Feifania hominis TaxID=2763660 RepID=A0A926DFZ1_9FIRM|nr:preprotein translocase subunit SecY [Feifania hominis]MBC8537112.1 preprotein translocase subunit SecY [Feifania hominis]